jgi:hypothetical protein
VLPKSAYHRRQNITKYVRGGNIKYSCLWLFNKLVKASSKQEIDLIKHEHAFYMDIKALNYLNSLTAIDAHEHQCFNELRDTEVSRRIFIRSQSLMAG